MRHHPMNFLRLQSAALGVILIAAALVMTGCATTQDRWADAPLVVYPLPPAKPRVQYLGSVASTADLPSRRGGFAEFVLGPPATLYPLAKPFQATIRGSKLYICDTVFNSVLVYDLVTGEAQPLEGDRGAGKIQQPNGLDFDEEGRLYVADRVRQAVLVYNPDESFHMALGRLGEAWPVAVAVSGDELFICDRDEHEIEVWNKHDGSLLRRFGGLGNEPGKFLIPTSIALGPDGSLFVTDTGNFRVQKLSPSGEHLATFGGPGRGLGQFAWPKGLDVDAGGRLFVADSRFANIQIFDAEGRLLLFFGGPGEDRGNMDLPAGLSVVPWPEIPMLRQRLMPGFDPESLVIAVSQQGQGFINFFAVARDGDGSQ